MLKKSATVALLIAAMVAIPLSVLALTNGHSSRVDLQTNVRRSKEVTTSSTRWRNVPGLVDARVCAQGQVTAMLSVNVSGGVVAFRVLYEDGPSLFPPKAIFDAMQVTNASPTRGFSFDFVGPASTFEGSDDHVYTVQWRSVYGQSVTVHRGLLDLLYQQGTRC